MAGVELRDVSINGEEVEAPPPPEPLAMYSEVPPVAPRPKRERLVIPKPNIDPIEDDDADQGPQEPYYWEDGPHGEEATDRSAGEQGGAPAVSMWTKLAHNVHFYGAKAVEGGEVVGEVVARFLGLTDSRFQYVVDALEQEQWERDQKEKEEAEQEEIFGLQQEQAADAREASLGGLATSATEAAALGLGRGGDKDGAMTSNTPARTSSELRHTRAKSAVGGDEASPLASA